MFSILVYTSTASKLLSYERNEHLETKCIIKHRYEPNIDINAVIGTNIVKSLKLCQNKSNYFILVDLHVLIHIGFQ